MRSSIESPSTYSPDSILNSSVVRKIIDFNPTDCDNDIRGATLNLGGKFQVPPGLTRIVETDHCGDLTIIRGFVKFEKKTYLIFEKIKSPFGTYVYTVTQGVAELINEFEKDVSINSLRNRVSDIVTSESDFCSYSTQYNDFFSNPVFSGIDNEGSSIYENVDSFNSDNIENIYRIGEYYGNSYIRDIGPRLNYLFGEGSDYLYEKDIVSELSKDELFTTGVIGARLDYLTGGDIANEVSRQLSSPITLNNWKIDPYTCLHVQNPVMLEKDSRKCIGKSRKFLPHKNVTPINDFSADLMDWLKDIHRLVFVGRFRYILPNGETVNDANCYPDDYLSNGEFKQVMRNFQLAFSSLIDFVQAKEIEISVMPSEEIFISVKTDKGSYTLYADFILVSIISLGLIRENYEYY